MILQVYNIAIFSISIGLQAMNPEYTVGDFGTAVDTLTEMVPGMQIATDIMWISWYVIVLGFLLCLSNLLLCFYFYYRCLRLP